jgi:hypothetical protein
MQGKRAVAVIVFILVGRSLGVVFVVVVVFI